jgi:outer membrane biosynthesis protein TonB
MTATHALPGSRDRTLLWGLLLSLLLHAVLFVPGVRNVFKEAVNLENIEIERPLPPAAPMEFTLVNPPPVPSEEPVDSRFASTASAKASDTDARDTGSEVPHGEGTLPFPENPSAAGAARPEGEDEQEANADSPKLPTEQEGLTEALQRSKWEPQEVTPAPGEPGFADETLDFYEPGSVRASIGGIQLNTTAWDFAPYLLDLKRRIKQKWVPPIAFTALGAVHGYTWVRFRIHPDGRMDGMEVIETEGHDSLHRSSANAVKGAAPFRPLPKDFPEEYLEIEFGFYYLLPGDENRFFKNGRFVRKGEEGSEK